ncbi:glycogen/starch synthase [Dysgonomonas sp. 520]|uniref:glycogen/starch synthase n=1 Tax=Dysgonomonas sp. 520 TaxID=2302931 RepID=UPI0013D6F5DD|nr:glycogen/starch synthase [Dysgonomonas sp. 520]NDW08836.1 glycosyl transferase [Dysgonomonas sp. 520]
MAKKQTIKESLSPDFVFETSWEVCNKVGGIYTVLSSKAKTMQTIYNENVLFIGPDIWDNTKSPWFREDKNLLPEWVEHARKKDGLKIKIGRWDVPGQPKTVLVDFTQFFEQKDKIYAQMWEKFGVDSMPAYGDYDESCMFAYATGVVIESYYKFHKMGRKKVIAHFNEWMLGMGLLYVKDKLPKVATVFTTHATTVGRSIASNNKPLYSQMHAYNGDQMAHELNVVSKHSIEKKAAQQSDCFTSVSGVTQWEATQLLECKPMVTPNGFEKDFVPKGKSYTTKRDKARQALINVTEKLTGTKINKNAVLIGTSGRYEYRNKGLDVFIDALNRVRYAQDLKKEVVAFIMVPAWVDTAREDLKERLLSAQDFTTPLHNPFITHNLHDINNDPATSQMRYLQLCNGQDNVKVVFIPSYLNGTDGIFDLTYYDLLIGLDATIFPSYYEPWGYTPHESIAFSVPTLTTSLAGFGVWAKTVGDCTKLVNSIRVITRDDDNFEHVSRKISEAICELSAMGREDLEKSRQLARKKAEIADWQHFFKYYEEAYHEALSKKK